MNPITWKLVKKDWQISEMPMLGYAALAVLALALLAMATGPTFYVSTSLLITIVVIVGVHMIFVSVVHERLKQNTLAFVMSLPITFAQYTRAKMLANLGIFGLAWLAIAIATTVIISMTELPNGLIPFALIVLGELFVANALILGVAMVTESEAWTIVVMAICNLCISLFIFFIGGIEAIGGNAQSPVAIWNSAVTTAMSLEVLALLIIVALTFFAQSRKHDYV